MSVKNKLMSIKIDINLSQLKTICEAHNIWAKRLYT